jgi:hypothetical protein
MNAEGTAQNPAATHEPLDALAAYVLGILDPDERREVEAHLATCEACRAELARQEVVVGELGTLAAPVPPRPELRETLLAEIHASAPEPDAQRAPTPIRRRIPSSWLGFAAAAALVTITMLGVLLARVADERDAAVHAEQEIAEYLADGGTLSPLLPAEDAPADVSPGLGSLAVAPNQDQAMLVLHGLAPSGDGRRYMAWAERDGERVRLGELPVNDEGIGWLVLSGPEPMSNYDTVGITRFTPDAPDGEPFLVASIQ